MQTNSHADTSTDLHSYLCVGIANTNTGNPTFFRPKNATWIWNTISSQSECSCDFCSEVARAAKHFRSLQYLRFLLFLPAWLARLAFVWANPPHPRIDTKLQWQNGSVGCNFWHSLHKNPHARAPAEVSMAQKLAEIKKRTDNIDKKYSHNNRGRRREFSNILAAGVVQLLSGKCRPELNQPAEVEMLGVEIQMNNLHAQLSSTRNNLGPNQVTVPRLHSHNIWSAFRQWFWECGWIKTPGSLNHSVLYAWIRPKWKQISGENSIGCDAKDAWHPFTC